MIGSLQKTSGSNILSFCGSGLGDMHEKFFEFLIRKSTVSLKKEKDAQGVFFWLNMRISDDRQIRYVEAQAA